MATSTVAYAETRAGLARRWREGDFTIDEYRGTVRLLDVDWNTFSRLEVSDTVADQAGSLAERYALKGCDAIHLASALSLVERAADSRFLAFDKRLTDAARRAGLQVIERT